MSTPVALPVSPAKTPWAPIESAPRDGTEVVLWCDSSQTLIRAAKWRNGGWAEWGPSEFSSEHDWRKLESYTKPTHWHKLTPPAQGEAVEPAVPEPSGESNSRTDKKIVEQTNALARKFYARMGYQVSDDFKFYDWSGRNAHPQIRMAWDFAVEAQLMLTCTDPNDALDNFLTD